VTVTTSAIAPVLTTTAASAITSTTASSGGNITSDGGSSITARGLCWAITQNPTVANFKTTDGTGSGTFTSNLTGLLPGTTYYVKAYATNSIGTSYGNQITVTTTDPPPSITTSFTSVVSTTNAISGGLITSNGGSSITARGVCWSTTQNPTINDSKTTDASGTGGFSSNINSLTMNTTYYLRAYGTNNSGTSYGNEVSFKTYNGTVTDIDGNVYNTIIIGTQEWMVENLKTTKYRNGDPIPNVTDNAAWIALVSGAYCWHNNDAANKPSYGGLYNWYAVADSRNLAPIGWHVPTDAEWTILTTLLGGESVAGGKLKETGNAHWHNPNYGATNSSGFTALPGEDRYANDGAFGVVGYLGYWWSSTLGTLGGYYGALCRGLDYNSAYFARVNGTGAKQGGGCSVRCIKD